MVGARAGPADSSGREDAGWSHSGYKSSGLRFPGGLAENGTGIPGLKIWVLGNLGRPRRGPRQWIPLSYPKPGQRCSDRRPARGRQALAPSHFWPRPASWARAVTRKVSYLQGHSPDQHLFVGHLIYGVGPIRQPWSKYYVPKIVMQEEVYPPYCGGGGFLLSRFTGAALRRAIHTVDLFPIDDVFMGMCLKQQGLKPTSHSGIRTAGVWVPSARLSSFDPCFYRELLLVHRFLPYEMLLMWDALTQPSLTCGKQIQIYQSHDTVTSL